MYEQIICFWKPFYAIQTIFSGMVTLVSKLFASGYGGSCSFDTKYINVSHVLSALCKSLSSGSYILFTPELKQGLYESWKTWNFMGSPEKLVFVLEFFFLFPNRPSVFLQFEVVLTDGS